MSHETVVIEVQESGSSGKEPPRRRFDRVSELIVFARDIKDVVKLE